MLSEPKVAPVKLTIASLSYRAVHTSSHGSMCALIATTPGVAGWFFEDNNPYLHIARNHLAQHAIDAWKAGQATHVLWLDDDMMFPYFIPKRGPDGSPLIRENGKPDTQPLAARLLSHGKEVVSAVYYKHDNTQPVAMGYDGKFLNFVPDTGVMKVGVVGFGCVMMRIDVLHRMQEHFKDELFQMPIQSDGKSMGEDVFFCKRLNEMGIPIYLDCEVQCGHLKIEQTNRDSHMLVWGPGGSAWTDDSATEAA